MFDGCRAGDKSEEYAVARVNGLNMDKSPLS